jgi:hypothetical protein
MSLVNHRTWLPALALLAFLAGSAISQPREITEVAELLPAQTLFCVEVRQPDKFAREIEALIKGSAFDDLPATMARFRAKLKGSEDSYFDFGVSYLGMFFSPEGIRDFGKTRGGAFAITGINKDGPEYVAVLLTGDSTLPRLFMRAVLSFDRMYIVQEVGGVNIYREKSRPTRSPNWARTARPRRNR